MEKLNVLLVDNDPGKLLTYEVMLDPLGENLLKANSGKQALDILLRNEVAVVLTDVNMPDLDGFQLVDLIREHPRYSDVAVLFISAVRMTDTDRLKGYAHGAVDYVTVPIVPELLRAKVRVFADLYRKARQLESLNKQMEELSGRVLGAQDEERRRIARELHDSLGQQLVLARMAADGIKIPEARKQASDIGELIDEALRQVRSISHLLHPPMLDEIGLHAALRWYLDGLTKRSRMETSLEVQSSFPRLASHVENALYRIVQEAITNAFRHSGGHHIHVVLRSDGKCVTLAVSDDGKGVPDEIAAFQLGCVGVGLGGMKQRAAELGGKLKLVNREPGTAVEVVIPVPSGNESLTSVSSAVKSEEC